MPDTPLHEPSTADRRFEAVVEQFLREREAGHHPDPQRYLQDFPDLASSLRDFFAGQELVDRLAPVLAPEVQHTPATLSEPTPAQIDRFQIKRFLGEGTFGRVFEAFDPSLKRIVALKVAKPDQLGSPQLVE